MTEERPIVTQSIIVLCVIVYGLQWVGVDDITSNLAFLPAEAFTQPYRFITSMFLHSPNFLLHIIMNMYALWLIGPYLERLFGRVRFAVLYVLSGLGGSVGYFVVVPVSMDVGSSWSSGVVGASGAIFGLFAALVVVNRQLGRDNTSIVGVILVNALIGFWPGLNIAWQAHLGGLVTGGAVAAVLARRPGRQVAGAQVGGLLAVLVLLAVMTIVKAALVSPGS